MNKYLLILLLPLLTRCAPKVSNYFDSTHYVESFYTHIVNDSLRLHMKTGGDIHFIREKDSLKQAVKRSNGRLDGLMAYGYTKMPPHYKLFLMLNPGGTMKPEGMNEVILDTLIQEKRLVLLCRAASGQSLSSTRSDCNGMFRSITTGKNYRENLASVFDLNKRFGNRYYQALVNTLDYPAQGRNEEWLKLQIALNYASFLAPNNVYESLLTKFIRPGTNDSTRQIIKDRAVHGKNRSYRKILELSAESDIVMFNEQHFFPSHRILLKELLPELKKIGFEYLALEALSEGQDSLLNAGHTPSIKTGYYTREQHFAELIRTGQELGFHFVAYENFDPEKDREQGQADNLYDKTFSKNKAARVIVLAGVDHILEKPTGRGKRWMAALFKERYDLDPLTISQSHLIEYGQMADPVALISSDNFNNDRLRSVDWLVLNNLPLLDTESNYLFNNGFDQTMQLALFKASEINKKTDPYLRIPFRTTLVNPAETARYRLPEGHYLQVVIDRYGKAVSEESIFID